MNKLFSIFKHKKAFTIAEMTVVLLILSLVMAAILPVTTNKRSGGGSGSSGGGNLWKLARNNTDIWFASPASTQSALLGTSITPDSQGLARLYINIPNSTTRSQIGFMYNNSTVGYLHYRSNNNIGMGTNSVHNTTNTASNNVGIGYHTLNSAISGSNNFGVGSEALLSSTSGSANTAFGINAMRSNTSGSNNIAIGSNSLYANESGSNNIALGNGTLSSLKEGNYNIALGFNALNATTGNNNIALGQQTLVSTTTGSNNIALGTLAGNSNTGGSSNIALGSNALRAHQNSTNNIAIGTDAIKGNSTSSSYNVGIGYQALYTNASSGSYNTAVGFQAGYYISSGTANVALGQNALNGTTTGSNNIGIGYKACNSITGSNKTCIGSSSGYTNLPAGFTANNTTSETILGNGSGNIFLHAGNVYVKSGTDTNTSAKLTINGNAEATTHLSAGTYIQSGTYLSVGSYANITGNSYTGDSAYANKTYTNHISARTGNSYSAEIWGNFTGTYNTVSDKRLKNIQGFANTGLNEIKQLNVYNFTYKDEPKVQRVGLIAQEVEKVMPYAVMKNKEGYLVLRQDNILFTMFNAIKDLDNLYENLKTKVQNYIIRLNLVEDRINALIKVNKDLSKRVDTLEKRIDTLEKNIKILEKNQCKCK